MLAGSVARRVGILVGAVALGLGVLASAGSAATTPPKFDHIVIVMEENHSFNEIIGSSSAPYINSLAPAQGALFTSSFAVAHPSQPNYVALFSGSTQGLTSDSCPHTFSANNVGNELRTAGLSYTSFSETMPADGSTVCTSGNYARKHNPSVNFSDLPATTNLRFTHFPTTAAGFAALPTVSFVDPNLQDDMHDGTIAQGDSWLASNLPVIFNSREYRDGSTAVFLTWDEGEGGKATQCATNTTDVGCHVVTIVISPSTKPGTKSGALFNHYSLLGT
ncbi:MAG TPA: alkaline phosphatase family protein, partial [Pseudonocardiaceae bacterium]|nr:alkaline phosphatase family protein [Pseudonocardiaceae bacterium]